MNTPSSALLTDLYQLTMLQGYFDRGMEETAVFEFFVRKLPPGRNFLVAAGLAQVIEYLQTLRFTDDDLQWAARSGRFTEPFIDYLSRLRFTGDVHAMPEGTVFFPDAPVLRVTAPLPQAQLVETRLVNILHYQTLIASKAVRCALAAPGKLLVDFGMRRAHGAEAALLAARASFLAGFAGTATVLASACFGVPVFGTMAHSFVQVHDREVEAFEHFAHAQPDNVVLLIDTYDTEGAARTVGTLADRLAEQGIRVKGVRIDSGDLADHARRVRQILDQAGHPDITVFASSSLDEHALAALVAGGAPIDGFGVGTLLDTSADHPYLDCVYKLQEYAGVARRKISEGKATWPGRKQVLRHYDADDHLQRDVLALEEEGSGGEPLLRAVMQDGRCVVDEPLETARDRLARTLKRLPADMRRLDRRYDYTVEVSDGVRALAARVDAAIAANR